MMDQRSFRPTHRPSLPAALGAWTLLLCLCGLTGSAAVEASSLLDDHPERRLVLIKVDGLPPDLVAAVAFPEREEGFRKLTYGRDLQRAVEVYQQQSGRQIVLPNIRHYFFERGVVFDNMFSATQTLSAVAWAVIDTGQPSVIKGHGTFSRDTCYLRSHLDGLRDTIDAIRRGEGKTAALWNLDQIGLSLISDAFDPARTWTGPQVYSRIAHRELLLEAGRRWLHNNESGVGDIARSHLSRQVTGIDYPDWNQELGAEFTARKILEQGLTGKEEIDYLSPLFTVMDHQQHVDPHPENLIYWLVKLDRLVGTVFRGVERSGRAADTLVALASDHGSEIDPGRTAISFPITKVFRTPLMGGHTVKTLLVEGAWNAISVPIPGIDFPRVYHSESSPYTKKGHPQGEDGYVTAFIDNFGNGRSSVFLRNNDLNRLHLLLLELRRQPQSPQRFERLRELFRSNLQKTRQWLDEDLALYRDYYEGAQDLARQLDLKADKYSRDSAWRLRTEAKRDRPQIEALERLTSITFSPDHEGLYFEEVFRRPFDVSAFLPKGYLGLANSVHQLSNYTIGLDEDLGWVETTVDYQGNPVPMDYFRILSDYRADNAPANGLYNPYDLILARLPVPETEAALRARGILDAGQSIELALWLKSTAKENPHKGGEAILLRSRRPGVAYLPVRGLQQLPDGSLRFEALAEIDPLGLLRGPGFDPPAGSFPADWVRRFQPEREWLKALHRTEYGPSLFILLDLYGNPVPAFVDDPEFQKYLFHFTSPELKERYLRGLKRKYASVQPDFVVWSNPLWNFNSKARTSGGSHAGLKPIVTNIAFMIWGGNDTKISRGRRIEDVCTTLDVAPTLLRTLGMLDDQNRVIRDPESIPERTFHPFPGVAIDLTAIEP